MMRRTAVLDVVGLTPSLIGPHTPFLAGWMAEAAVASLRPVLPAVTCSMQASMLTGLPPSGHGIPGNGWYDRCSAEIRFWRQSSHLVQAPRVWDAARAIDPGFTCANLFWWFAMYAATDIAVTPRPMYPADGRKIPDVWTSPPELRQELQRRLGQFPLFEILGAAHHHPLQPLDRRGGEAGRGGEHAGPLAGLSAASRLRLAAAGAGASPAWRRTWPRSMRSAPIWWGSTRRAGCR